MLTHSGHWSKSSPFFKPLQIVQDVALPKDVVIVGLFGWKYEQSTRRAQGVSQK